MRSRRNWIASRIAWIGHNTPSMYVGSNENVQIGIREHVRKDDRDAYLKLMIWDVLGRERGGQATGQLHLPGHG